MDRRVTEGVQHFSGKILICDPSVIFRGQEIQELKSIELLRRQEGIRFLEQEEPTDEFNVPDLFRKWDENYVP